jgi:hypothetical protein
MGFELDWTASARQLLNDKFAGKFVGGLPFGKDACEAGLGDIPDSGIAVVSGFDVNDCHRFISLGHTSYGYLAQARTNSLARQVISDGTNRTTQALFHRLAGATSIECAQVESAQDSFAYAPAMSSCECLAEGPARPIDIGFWYVLSVGNDLLLPTS